MPQQVLGKPYIFSLEKQVISKKHNLMSECCKFKMLWKTENVDNQTELFDLFYNALLKAFKIVSYLIVWNWPQNVNRTTVNQKKPREHIWTYNVSLNGKNIEVCRKLFLNLFQISTKHLRVIQQNILLNESFEKKG